MVYRHIYRPNSGTQGAFDAGSEAGVGVSARNWGGDQLNELGIVFEWDWPLYSSCSPHSEPGLLDARLNAHPTSRLGSALRRSRFIVE